MSLPRSHPWALARVLAYLIFAALFGSSTAAFAQDDEDDPSSEEADDDDDGGDDESDAGDDDEDDDEDDDDDDEDDDAKPSETPESTAEQAPAAEADESDEQVEGSAAEATTDGVDVLGWRRGDLRNVLGEQDYPRLDLGAYVRGGIGFRVRPDALPADEIEYGFNGRAGLRVNGAAHRMWRARIWLEFRGNALDYVQDIQSFDANNDGVGVGLTIDRASATAVLMEQAVASFVPWEFLAFEAGIQRIPFTLQQQSKNTATLFPDRSNANNVFFSGSDIGALVRGNFFDGRFLTSLGVWDGQSLGLGVPFARPRGVVISYRADVNPFGAFPFGEGDKERGPFRLGVGGGLIYRPTTIFDARTGTEPRSVQDLRFSGSLRMAWAGLFVAAEYFRRQQVDDFTFRPQIADGAYAQLAYYIDIASTLGLEPSLRLGFVNADQTFDPRLTGYVDAGVSFYPIASDPGAVRIWLTYLGERRFTEGEDAHGGSTSVQIRF
jgi:hypothetical protein